MVIKMSETKSTYEHKGLPAQLITIMSGTTVIRSIPIPDADSVDLSITITEIKTEKKAE
jgi:hypothetical protein